MAFIGHEGFDAFSGSNQSVTAFDFGAPNSVSTSGPRYTGGQHCAGTDFNQPLGWNIANQQKVIQGAAFKKGSGTSTSVVFRIYDGSTVHVSLQLDYDNKVIKVYRGDASTLLGTSSVISGSMLANAWMYVEWEVVIDNSAGTIKVWVDGASTPTINLSGQDTQNTANAYATKAGFSVADTLDDLYLLDGSGSAPFNARLGDYRVYTLVPTSDDSVQFTPLSGTNFSNVDDLGTGGSDGDTTYVESGTVGHIDRYGLTDLPVGVIPVAVEQRVVAKKTDAGTRELRMKLDSGGVNSNDTTRALATSYTQYRRLMEVDPTDSGSWTRTKVNALKPGFEVVT